MMTYHQVLLFILQCFDWLSAFHLDLLQTIFSLLRNCQFLVSDDLL